MSKHTPGPWTAACTRVGGEVAAFSICAREYGSLNPICEGSFGFSDDMQANAHLIAAAPEMLEALKEALEYFNDRADAEYFPGSAAPVGNIEMKLAGEIRFAIAKAEGRS